MKNLKRLKGALDALDFNYKENEHTIHFGYSSDELNAFTKLTDNNGLYVITHEVAEPHTYKIVLPNIFEGVHFNNEALATLKATTHLIMSKTAWCFFEIQGAYFLVTSIKAKPKQLEYELINILNNCAQIAEMIAKQLKVDMQYNIPDEKLDEAVSKEQVVNMIQKATSIK